MPIPQEGAQRASGHRTLRLLASLAIAAVFATTGLVAHPAPAAAATMKVVIVVGPVGSATAGYITSAKKLAAQARSYGAYVVELYSPHATWARVKSYAQGANVLIYLGHGNGYPSPYGAFSAKSKDGMGLNTTDGSTSHTYYGEYYIDHDIQLAPNAVVILNRLCYASGNNEWGSGYPSRSTAMARVDNYGAGFLRANAKAVFAEGIDSVSYILYGLFRTNRNSPRSGGATRPAMAAGTSGSSRPGRRGTASRGDPIDGSSRYYRSLVGNIWMTAKEWRAGPRRRRHSAGRQQRGALPRPIGRRVTRRRNGNGCGAGAQGSSAAPAPQRLPKDRGRAGKDLDRPAAGPLDDRRVARHAADDAQDRLVAVGPVDADPERPDRRLRLRREVVAVHGRQHRPVARRAVSTAGVNRPGRRR